MTLSSFYPWKWEKNHSKEKSHGKTFQILWGRERGEGETEEKINKCPQQQCSTRIWTWRLVLAVCIWENTSSGVIWRCLKENEWAEVQVFTFSQLPINIGFSLLENSSEYFHNVYEIYFEVLKVALHLTFHFVICHHWRSIYSNSFYPGQHVWLSRDKLPGIPKGEKHNLKRQRKHRTIHGRGAGIKRQQNSHEG